MLGTQEGRATLVFCPCANSLPRPVANMAPLCPRACGQLAPSWQPVPSTARGDGAAEPCCAGSAPAPSPKLLLACTVRLWGVTGSPCLVWGSWWHRELFASACCCQGTARVLVPSTEEHLRAPRAGREQLGHALGQGMWAGRCFPAQQTPSLPLCAISVTRNLLHGEAG